MNYHVVDLFCGIYNTINEHNLRQTHYLSSVTNYFNMSDLKRSFITSSASSLIMTSTLSLVEYKIRFSFYKK